jgi:hypothetical protein
VRLLVVAVILHVAAVIIVLASGGVSAPEDTPVALGALVPWASGLAGCAVVVAGGLAARAWPLRVASALQAAGVGAWAVVTRAPHEAGTVGVTACAATVAGAVLAALHRPAAVSPTRGQ